MEPFEPEKKFVFSGVLIVCRCGASARFPDSGCEPGTHKPRTDAQIEAWKNQHGCPERRLTDS